MPVLAAGTLALAASAPANADEVAASAVLADPPEFDGMTGRPGEGSQDVTAATTSHLGRTCWYGDSDVGNDYLYFRVDDDRVPDDATDALVTLEYFDAGEGNFTIHYDGPSAFTKADTVELVGDGAWKSYEFELNDIRFDGRTNSHDFRIANWDASFGRSPTPVCVAEVEVSFTALPALTLTSPNFVFTTGEAVIDLSSTASTAEWELLDEYHLPLLAGETTLDDGVGSIDLTDLGPGYYNLTVTMDAGDAPIQRQTSLAVLEPLSDGAINPDEPFGIGTHFAQAYGFDLIPIINEIGFSHVRDEMYWSHVENEEGVYTFPAYSEYVPLLAERGITPIFVATYSNGLYDDGKTPSTPEGQAAYARYASAVLDHFGDDLTNVEIFNEFNIGFNTGECGRTPDCYLPLLQASAERIRADHPDALIAGPATSTAAVAWIKRLIDLGGLDYVDAISTHPYRYPGAPETGLDGEIQELRDYIQENNDGEDKDIWLTEIGWPTFTGSTPETTQADYLIRTYAIALANGTTRLYWYDLLNDGDDPGSNEHNYGILHRPQPGVNGYAPKPAAVSAAVMIRALAGKPYTDQDDVGESIHSYQFGTGDDVTRVQWATDPRTVELATDEPVRVTDRYGRVQTLTPLAGSVQLDLTGHPVFVEGSITDVTALDAPTFSVSVPERIAVGEDVPVTFSVDRTDPRNAPGKVTFRVGDIDTVVKTAPGEVGTATVELPASQVTGERTVTAEVLVGRARARVEATTMVAPTTEIAVVPVIGEVSPLSGEVSIEVTNNSAVDALEISAASWTIDEQPGSSDQAVPVEPGETGRISVPVPDAVAWDPYSYEVSVTLADGTELEESGTTGFGPIMPAGDETAPAIDLESQGVYRELNAPFEGPEDLSGTVRVTSTDDDLVLSAEITDDVFWQPNTGPDMWLGDSLQVGVSPLLPGKTPSTTEFGVGLLDEGPVVYTLLGGAPGETPGAVADISRAGTTTSYEVSVPWTSLGMDGAPDEPFALSFLVNDDDNDGAGRAGWVYWGSGIGGTKTTTLYRPVELIEP